MLAFVDLSAANWTSEGEVTIEDHDLDGDAIFDSVKITLGDESIGPQDRVAILDNGYYMFAALELPWATSVMVDVESYELQTYAATDEVSSFSIGFSNDAHIQLPPDTMWQPSYQGILPRTATGSQRMYGRATTDAYVLHVGVAARGITEPTDDGASHGTFIIRNIDVRSEDQPHDPDCEQEARAGSNHGSRASLRNGEASFTISLNAAGQLHYNSFDNPHPILTTDYVLPDPAPDRIEVTIEYEFNYPGFERPTVSYATQGLSPDERVTVALRPSIPFEGAFNYALKIRPFHGDVPGAVETIPGRYAVQDRRFSEFGNRFSWMGLDYLVPQFTPSGEITGIQLSRSDSNAIWFSRSESGEFRSPVGVFLELEELADQTYVLRDHLGHTSRFDLEGSLVARLDANGNETRYEYQPNSYLLSRIIDPYGRITQFDYEAGLLRSVTDFAGRRTDFGYFGNQLVEVKLPDPDGAGPATAPVTTFRYDAAGRVVEVEDPRGHVTVSRFDARGLITGGTHRDGASWTVRSTFAPVLVDPTSGLGTAGSPAPAVRTSDLISQTIDARGYAHESVTDHFGLSQSVVDPLQHRFGWTRDQLGRILERWEPDPDGSAGPLTELITAYQYADCANVSQTTYADHAQVRYRYNALSRPIPIIDELNRMTLLDYDGVDLDGDGSADGPNRVAHTQVLGDRDFILPRHPDDPDDLITTYRYSHDASGLPQGLLLSETDPRGITTQHIYETDSAAHDFGWVIETVYAVGTQEEASVHFEYDSAGNVTAMVNELGHRTEYQFDALDRLVTIISPDPNPYNGTADDQPVQRFSYDGNDNLVLAVDAEGRRTAYRYDQENRLVEVKQERPDGPQGVAPHRITSYTYDAHGNRISEVDPLGRVTRFHYDPLDRLIAVVGADVDGQDVRVRTNPINPFDVNADGQVDIKDLTSIVENFDLPLIDDPRHHTPDYVDVNGDHVVDADDEQAVPAFQVAADANGDGRVDADESLSAGVFADQDRLGRPIRTYRYDAVGNIAAIRDENGNETTFRFDARHRLIETTYPLITTEFGVPVHDAETSYLYDDAGQKTAEIDTLGRVTRYQYDHAGRLISIQRPDAGQGPPTTTFRYDPAGNLQARVDPLGKETTFSYDARNRLIRTTEPDPNPVNATTADTPETIYEFDAAGRLVRKAAPEGRVTEYHYDDLGRLVETGLPDPGTGNAVDQPIETLAYDRVGNLVGHIDGEGNLTHFVYDALDRLHLVINEEPDGPSSGSTTGFETEFDLTQLELLRTGRPVTEYRYDAVDNLTRIIDPLGQETRYAFDALNRLTTKASADPITGIAPAPTQLVPGEAATPMMAYTYDLVGNLISEQDASHPPTTYTYDAWHRRITETDPLGHTVTHHYDLSGNHRFLTDAVQNRTEWRYDALDRVIAEIDPLGAARSYTYDQVNNLVQQTDRNGRVIVWEYDGLHRHARESWYASAGQVGTQPVQVIESEYDAAGRRTAIADSSASYAHGYDRLDRLVTTTQQIDGLSPSITFTHRYDRSHQRLETHAMVGGTTDTLTAYAFDNLHRLRQMEQTGGNVQDVAFKKIQFAYDLAGQRERLARTTSAPLPAVETTYEFDAARRLRELGHSHADGVPIANYQLEYAPDHRLTSWTSAADRDEDAQGHVMLAYDHRGQLTHVNHDFAHYQVEKVFDYDANGNREQVTTRDATGGVLQTDSYLTETANRVVDDGQFTYTYDQEGNRRSRTEIATGQVTSYEWDHRNRLIAVTSASPGEAIPSHGEVGVVSVAQPTEHEWTTVTLQGSYRDPVVITSPATRNDASPTTVRVRNVTSHSFQVQLDEWDYQDGVHGEEQLGYLVIEAGRYGLPDGTQIEAGRLSTDHTWQDHLFRTAFAETPTVITSVMSARDAPAITTRISELTASGFRIRVREQEAFARDPELRVHGMEQTSYIAVAGNSTLGVPFEVGTLTTGMVANERTPIPVSFERADLDHPIVFAALQTHAGGNALALRQQALGPVGVDLFIEEEMSADTETRHVSELLGYLAFQQAAQFTLPAAPPGGEAGTVAVAPDTWVPVELERDYRDPVVVTGPIHRAGDAPLTARVRNVTSRGFEVQLASWESLPSGASETSVGFLVLEAGRYAQDDGTIIEAGHATVDHRWTSHQFSPAGFVGEPPLVFASAATVHESSTVAVRLDGISTQGFRVRLQEEEAARRDPLRQTHANERVSFVAIGSDGGQGQLGGIAFGATQQPTGVIPAADAGIAIEFPGDLGAAEPMLFANLQTFNGGNTVTLRYDQLTSDDATLFVEEETSFDPETRHRSETVGYLMLAESGPFELGDRQPRVEHRVEHRYDANNRWIGRWVDGDGDLQTTNDQTRTRWVHHEGQIVYEFVDSTTTDPVTIDDLTKRYLWSDQVDELLAQESVNGLPGEGELRWALGDHLGTVRDVVDETGQVLNHRTYDAFGTLVHETQGDDDVPFGFTGKYFDDATGLQNNWHRWYDAEGGKWISDDPIGFAAGDANLSRYVGNAVTLQTDPSGLQEVSPTMVARTRRALSESIRIGRLAEASYSASGIGEGDRVGDFVVRTVFANERTGYRSLIFQNPKSGRAVMAFAGTDDNRDVIIDIGQGLGWR
ncbi:MAG: RHS repeat-associated core domain-containing protein, partial [Planctomycetota bacterium]